MQSYTYEELKNMSVFEILTKFKGINTYSLGLDTKEKLVDYLCDLYPDNFRQDSPVASPSPVRQASPPPVRQASPPPPVRQASPIRQPSPVASPIRQPSVRARVNATPLAGISSGTPMRGPPITPDIQTHPIRPRTASPVRLPTSSFIPAPYMRSVTPTEPFPTTPPVPLEQDTDTEIDSDEDVERRLSRLTTDKPVHITKLTEMQNSVVKCLMEI